jgi:amidase
VTLPTTARSIAEAVRAGRISATSVIEQHLDRIETENPTWGALVAVRRQGSLADAAVIDDKVRAGIDVGPLAGVPFTVKDIIATRDLPTTCGSRALAGYQTGFDAKAVTRLREAGAILLGKSNTPEFAFGVDTVNALYGHTKNPRGPFTVGGSSGGEAAAVAARMSAFGLGSDFGGSLRWPAQCAGLVGMRPAIGTVPQSGQLPLFGERPDRHGTLQALVQTIGPITQDVADSALVMAVLTGASEDHLSRLTTSWTFLIPEYLADVEIQWGASVADAVAAGEVRNAIRSAAHCLAGRGAKTLEGLPDVVDEAAGVYADLRSADPLTSVREAIEGKEDLVEERTRALLSASPDASDYQWAPAWEARRRLVSVLDSVLGSNRLLLLPVATKSPAAMSSADIEDFGILIPSRAVSLFGLPAISVPWSVASDGGPVSVQLVAPRGREDLLYAVAGVLESARQAELAARC